MALSHSNQAWIPDSVRLTPSVPQTVTSTVREEKIEVIHEFDTNFRSNEIRHERLIGPSNGWTKIGPSNGWTKVVIKSLAALPPTHRSASYDYMAAVRRRESKKLHGIVSELDKHSTRQDFAVCTHPLVVGIKTLLIKLLEIEAEGNTREILRRLRDTFLDGGWSRYKEPAKRDLALQVLQFLSDAEAVSPQDASRFFDLMYREGLRPVGLPLFEPDEEDLEDNGHEETEAAH